MRIELLDSKICSSDLESIYDINQANQPAVGSLDSINHLEDLIKLSYFVYVSRDSKKITGFIILFRECSEYLSLNYQFFTNRHKNFFYIDRVAVEKDYRRQGIGFAFYRFAISYCNQKNLPLCCEVNKEPFNKVSMIFHENLKFDNIGSKVFTKGKREVFYLEKKVD